MGFQRPCQLPHRLHVWWARWPLVASRAILVSLLPSDADRAAFLHAVGIHPAPSLPRRVARQRRDQCAHRTSQATRRSPPRSVPLRCSGRSLPPPAQGGPPQRVRCPPAVGSSSVKKQSPLANQRALTSSDGVWRRLANSLTHRSQAAPLPNGFGDPRWQPTDHGGRHVPRHPKTTPDRMATSAPAPTYAPTALAWCRCRRTPPAAK